MPAVIGKEWKVRVLYPIKTTVKKRGPLPIYSFYALPLAAAKAGSNRHG
jgi:hypothetical protein